MGKEARSLNWFTPEDVARRLHRRKPYWRCTPKVLVDGDEGKFGKLFFDFTEEADDIPDFYANLPDHEDDYLFGYNVYIADKARMQEIAEEAVNQFSEIINEVWKRTGRC